MTSAAIATAQGRETARNLRGYGIDADLAPVLDVGHGGFIANRTFGNSPGNVAARAVAFARGLALGGVLATASTSPASATPATNTDTARTVIRSERAKAECRPVPVPPRDRLGPADGDGLDRAVSGARDRRAGRVLAKRPLQVCSAISSASAASSSPTRSTRRPSTRTGPTAEAAVEAIGAGVDMVLPGGSSRTADSTSEAVYRAIVAAATSGTLPRATLAAAYARVLKLKRSL